METHAHQSNGHLGNGLLGNGLLSNGHLSNGNGHQGNGHHKDGLIALSLDMLIKGDARHVLASLPDASVNLVFTSPPYGDNRSYKGPKYKDYVDWFLPMADEIHRILKPDGSFVLNIKERAADGERQTYVLELILALKKQGWYWIDEYIWHKKNSFPGKWPNRFRDAWERCLHFTVNKQFAMYQDAVRVPIGDWAKGRLKNLSEADRMRRISSTGSGQARNVANWLGRDTVYPSNVLYLPTECSNRGHSATFPKELPEWFIRLFTKEGDVVLDPFMGSGTTGVACVDTARSFIGVDLDFEYVEIAKQAIEDQRNRRRAGPAPVLEGVKS